jgi:phosphoribosyl 1,2-cyclic phosphodiesterase
MDAGFSCKRMKEMLAIYNIYPEQISAIFITQGHFDHIQGLRDVSKFRCIKYFKNKNTTNARETKHRFNILWQTFSITNRLQFNDLTVVSFSVPHDAVGPIGYVFILDASGSIGGMKI